MSKLMRWVREPTSIWPFLTVIVVSSAAISAESVMLYWRMKKFIGTNESTLLNRLDQGNMDGARRTSVALWKFERPVIALGEPGDWDSIAMSEPTVVWTGTKRLSAEADRLGAKQASRQATESGCSG
jgi:hypothetical protein